MHGVPRYFPVSTAPLKMAAGLLRHGSDFGQGAWDQRFFQVDSGYERYVQQKRAAPSGRHVLSGYDGAAQNARASVLAWMRTTLTEEAPAVLARADADDAACDPLEALARALQEDFAIVCDSDEGDRIVAVDIRFPSGFRGEASAGASFYAIHGPVPGFVADPRAARSMVQAMTQRGPYVRFVWALCTDDALDHHPEAWSGNDWDGAEQAFLRVERQITVPFPDARASLFLIRTHIYETRSLSATERAILASSVASAPAAIRAYKRFPTDGQLSRLLASTHAAAIAAE